MAFLDRFRKHGGLLCPRCEEALDTHDEEKCRRRMTRRHFVGIWGAAVAVAYGGDKILLATESQVKALEKQFQRAAYMVSHRRGIVSTSLIHIPQPDDEKYWVDPGIRKNITRDPALEVLKLRALGFHVTLSNTLQAHEVQARLIRNDILAGRVPDTDPMSEFPSVHRW